MMLCREHIRNLSRAVLFTHFDFFNETKDLKIFYALSSSSSRRKIASCYNENKSVSSMCHVLLNFEK